MYAQLIAYAGPLEKLIFFQQKLPLGPHILPYELKFFAIIIKSISNNFEHLS